MSEEEGVDGEVEGAYARRQVEKRADRDSEVDALKNGVNPRSNESGGRRRQALAIRNVARVPK
jgi:hypothetical protein